MATQEKAGTAAAPTAAARKNPAAKVVKKSTAGAKTPARKAVNAVNAVKAVLKAAAKPAKEKKPKLVRDSFTIPKTEYAVLDELKQRAGKLASPAKKSELLRAGIKALAAMSDSTFVAALKAVPAIKTGRPAKE